MCVEVLSVMYEAFYKLGSDPFRLLPDPEVFFPHRSCARAWAFMRYALKRAEGIVVVTGPPGSGKTSLAARMASEFNPANTLCVRLVADGLDATELLRRLGYAFGLSVEGMDRARLAHRLERYLLDLEQAHRRALVIIDEAQVLDRASLEALRLLTDLQSRAQPVMQLFLFGQEPLEDIMRAPDMAQFQQRVIAGCRLQPMSLSETKAYLEYRLGQVHWRGDPAIDGAAVAAIHQFSRGLPRHVNKIGSRLLLHGCTEDKHALTRADVVEVVNDLREELLAPHDQSALPAVEVAAVQDEMTAGLALVALRDEPAAGEVAESERLSTLFVDEHRLPSPRPDAPGGKRPVSSIGSRDGTTGRFYMRSAVRRPRASRLLPWFRAVVRDFGAVLLTLLRVISDRAAEAGRWGLALRQQWRPALQRIGLTVREWLSHLDRSWRPSQMQGLTVFALVCGVAVIIGVTGGGEDTGSEGGMASRELQNPMLKDEPMLGVLSANRSSAFLASALSGDQDTSVHHSGYEEESLSGVAYASGSSHTPSALAEVRRTGIEVGGLLPRAVARSVSDGLATTVVNSGSTLELWAFARPNAGAPDQTLTYRLSGGLEPMEQMASRSGEEGKTTDEVAKISEPVGGDTRNNKFDTGMLKKRIAVIIGDQKGLDPGFVHLLPSTGAGRPAEPPVSTRVASGVVDDEGQAASEPPVTETLQSDGKGDTGETSDRNETQQVAVVEGDEGVARVNADSGSTDDIGNLLAQAQAAFKKDRLLLPEKESATYYYRRVLSAAPNNRLARHGLERVVRRYVELTEAALDSGSLVKAERFRQRANRVVPGHKTVDELGRRIAAMQAAMQEQQLAAVESEGLSDEMEAPHKEPKPEKRSSSAFDFLMGLVNN